MANYAHFTVLQHPPTFAAGERVNRIARRASFDGQMAVMVMQQPYRDTEPKRHSLMEPLVRAEKDAKVAATPPVCTLTFNPCFCLFLINVHATELILK